MLTSVMPVDRENIIQGETAGISDDNVFNRIISGKSVESLKAETELDYTGNARILSDIHSSAKKVVLLQGPVGPFFRILHRLLDKNGFDVQRILFNAGDRLYASHKNNILFNGDVNQWALWFRSFLLTHQPDCIILFGSERIIHRIARNIAEFKGIHVISLEEGYLRPGYITAEYGANNWLSPIAGKLPPHSAAQHAPSDKSQKAYKSFYSMCRHGLLYYMWSSLLSAREQKQLMHRDICLWQDMKGWIRNFYLSYRCKKQDRMQIKNLIRHHKRRYFIVPLQVHNDMQMGRAALGWNNERLILETLQSFAKDASQDLRLVFKVHPLERGHSSEAALIRRIAADLGIAERVDVLHTGTLAPLTKRAAGMITINSTSGFSALFHGIPLLVVGDAVYAHDALAVCAKGKPDFSSFWHSSHVADEALRKNYLAWLTEKSLLTGDFYAAKGIDAACQNILKTLLHVQTKPERDMQVVGFSKTVCNEPDPFFSSQGA